MAVNRTLGQKLLNIHAKLVIEGVQFTIKSPLFDKSPGFGCDGAVWSKTVPKDA